MHECVCAIVGRRVALPQPHFAPQENGAARSFGKAPRRPPARPPPALAASGMSSRCDRNLSPVETRPSRPRPSKPHNYALSHRRFVSMVSRRSREESGRPPQGHRQGDHGQLDAPDRLPRPAGHQKLRRQHRPTHTGKCNYFEMKSPLLSFMPQLRQ